MAEPIFPILLVLIVTLGAYGFSRSDLLIILFSDRADVAVEERTLADFRDEYFEDAALPAVQDEETVDSIIEASKPTLALYIEIQGGCGPHFEGACVNARTDAGTSSPAVLKLRNGIVLRTDGLVTDEYGGQWHKVIFDEWVRYPERARTPFYVLDDFTVPHVLEVPRTLESGEERTEQRIVVDRSEQRLVAYEADGTVYMDERISTGLDATPTPRGTFTIFRKTPTRYMQGPLPGISNDYYDLPGVPWSMYFTEQGGAIHGAYWHDKFGQKWSHGCVNLPLDKARELYLWAELGTEVVIRD